VIFKKIDVLVSLRF